jgi:hypothetical protein
MVYNKFLLLFWKSSMVIFSFKRKIFGLGFGIALPVGLTDHDSSPWDTKAVETRNKDLP